MFVLVFLSCKLKTISVFRFARNNDFVIIWTPAKYTYFILSLTFSFFILLNVSVTTPFPIRPEWRIRIESGARDYILGLIDLFFLRAELVPVVIQTISVITKIIFIYKKNYHQSGIHQNLYTYAESHLLIHVHFFF